MQPTPSPLTGKIFYFNGTFGYLSVDGSVERVFFHGSELPSPIVGEAVSFTLGKYGGRLCAINIAPISLCAPKTAVRK
jgi:cold shock CspA family protein